MRRYSIVIILLFLSIALKAQVLKGVVVNGETFKPVAAVTIINLTSQRSTFTEADGRFVIAAATGDKLAFSLIGFKTLEYTTTPSIGATEVRIALLPLTYQLQEYTVRPDYTPYQADSAARANVYRKELNINAIKPSIKPALGGAGGIGVNGLIGSVVQKMSKSYKQTQKFKKEFNNDEHQRFIDTRYTPEMVGQLTKLSGDSLSFFIYSYPMDYDFARSASDLEIKMWVRYNFKQYIHQQDQGKNMAETKR